MVTTSQIVHGILEEFRISPKQLAAKSKVKLETIERWMNCDQQAKAEYLWAVGADGEPQLELRVIARPTINYPLDGKPK